MITFIGLQNNSAVNLKPSDLSHHYNIEQGVLFVYVENVHLDVSKV